jgi:hypothetical protein
VIAVDGVEMELTGPPNNSRGMERCRHGIRRIVMRLSQIAVRLLGIVCVLTLTANCANGGQPERSEPSDSTITCLRSIAAPDIATITDADNGRVICVSVGTRIEVYLHGSVENPWRPIVASGLPLATAVSGKGTLALGVTGGFFNAVHAGPAGISSARDLCPSPSAGSAGCNSLAAFNVTIQVH